MKKTLLIVFLILGIIAGLAFSFYISFFSKNEEKVVPTTNTTNAETTTDETTNSEEIKNPEDTIENSEVNNNDTSNSSEEQNDADKSDIDIAIEENNGEYQAPDNKQGQVLDEATAKAIEEDARVCFRGYDYANGIKILKDAIETYNLGDNGKMIEKLYYDSSLIIQIPTTDLTGTINILNSLSDPELFLIATLTSDPDARSYVLVRGDSMNPILNMETFLLVINGKSTESSGEYFDSIKFNYPTLESLTRIDFNLDGNDMYAYFLHHTDGTVDLFTIKSDLEIKPYLTLSKWLEYRDAQS